MRCKLRTILFLAAASVSVPRCHGEAIRLEKCSETVYRNPSGQWQGTLLLEEGESSCDTPDLKIKRVQKLVIRHKISCLYEPGSEPWIEEITMVDQDGKKLKSGCEPNINVSTFTLCTPFVKTKDGSYVASESPTLRAHYQNIDKTNANLTLSINHNLTDKKTKIQYSCTDTYKGMVRKD